MTVRLILGISVLVAVSPAFAQPAPKAPAKAPPPADDMAAFEKDLDALFVQGGLTADQAASRAPGVSPTVQRQVAQLEAAIATAEAAELSLVPVVTGRASYTRLSFIAPLISPTFVFEFFQNNYLLEAQTIVPVSDYALRFPKLIKAARLGEDAARTSKRSTEVGVSEDARETYYEWVRSRLQVLVAQRQLLQVQATLKQVRALAEVQRLSKADLLRVESQEATAQQTLDQLVNLATLREEQLRILIGAGEEPLAIGEDIRRDLTAPTSAALDDLMKHAIVRRLDLRSLELGIQAKDQQRKAEYANMFPHLSGFATADYANPNSRIFPPQAVFKFTWAAGAQLTWTLNDTLISRTTEHRLAAETNELRADRENLLRGTRIEILAAQQAVQLAVRALETTQKGLVASEEGYRVRKELLNAERATAVELVDAQTDLTRARISALNARIDLRVALAQLAHALGDDTGH